jgi:hypothetical protein
MMIAQQLYEGIELPGEEAAIGLITYMRTDSVRVADQALDEVRAHIREQYGDAYVPEQANRYKVKTSAQDAHEAIRPTSMTYNPEAVRAYLSQDQYYLYRLIWNRFIASQMMPALFDDTTVDVTATPAASLPETPACSAPRAPFRSSPAGWPPTGRAIPKQKRASALNNPRRRRKAPPSPSQMKVRRTMCCRC